MRVFQNTSVFFNVRFPIQNVLLVCTHQILTGQIVEIGDVQQQRFSVFGSEMADIMDQTTRSISTKFDGFSGQQKGGYDQDVVNTGKGLHLRFLSLSDLKRPQTSRETSHCFLSKHNIALVRPGGLAVESRTAT